MKKHLLSTLVMALACFGAANATITITSANIEQPMGDTLLFPATTNEVRVEGEVKFLETYV